MRFKSLPLLLGVIALVLAACGGFKLYSIANINFAHKAGRLANGMQLVMQPDTTSPFVLVTLHYNVGSAHEPKDKRGMAHLVEHLAFRLNDTLVPLEDKQAESQPASQAAEAVSAGATPPPSAEKKARVVRYMTEQNAHTSFDETYYYKRVVPPHLEDVLKSFATQMGDFSTQISDDVLKTEREVVHNERRARYENAPLSQWWLDLYNLFYPQEHPYQGHAVIGSHETIASIQRNDISAFLSQHYHPANATLTITGPIDLNQTLAMVTHHFGGKERKEPSKLVVPQFTPTYREEVVVVPKSKNTMVTVAWPLGSANSEEVLALELIDSSMGGLFHYWLVTSRGWAFWAYSSVYDHPHGSLFIVQALVRDPDDTDAVRKRILEIAPMLASDLEEKDFTYGKGRQSYDYLYEAETPNERALAVSRYFSTQGQPAGFTRDLDRVFDMPFATARAHGKRLLTKERAFVMIHTPKPTTPETQEQAPAAQATYSVSAAKKAADGGHKERDTLPRVYEFSQDEKLHRAWAKSAIETEDKVQRESFTLDNGIRCNVMHQGSLPLTAVTVSLGGGLDLEPKDKKGVADLALSSMGLSSYEDRMSRYNMGLRSWSDSYSESLQFSYTVPSFYVDRAFNIIVEAISSPRFTQTTLSDQRTNMLRALKESEDHVGSLAARAYWHVFGLEDHHGIATAKTVDNVGLFDLWSFHKAIAYPENAVVSVVSNKPIAEIRPLMKKHFGDWDASGRKAWTPRGDTLQKPKARLVMVPVKDSSQTQLTVSYPASGAKDWQRLLEDRGVSILLDTKLRRLREAMGVTYGVNAWVDAFFAYGALRVGTKVQSDATDRALERLWKVLKTAKDERINQGELEFVRRTLIEEAAESGAGALAKAQRLNHATKHNRPAPSAVIAFVEAWDLQRFQAVWDHALTQSPLLVVAGEEPTDEVLKKLPEISGESLRMAASELL